MDEFHVDKERNLDEGPVETMERNVKKLKNKRYAIVKVRWNARCRVEFIWGCEDVMGAKYL